ncbi:MAG: DNA topoisomerase IV subunit A, partial [Planctomycetota bacterium]
MAKKKRAAAGGQKTTVRLTPRDKKTLGSLVGLADRVVTAANGRRDPYVDIPSRTLSNVKYSARKKIIEMGTGKNRRQLFDLSQAKAYMRTMLVASGTKRLIDQGKSTSLRGLFYMLKHTIEGAKENTFDDQNECDTIIEDVEVLLNSIREELHLYAENRGAIVGNISFTDKGDEINCARMGSGGYAIPSIVEPEVIEFDKKKCDAKFVLHVEKGTVWQRFNEDRFWETHNCILTHGSGQPPRGVRRLLYRLHNELKLPVYCVLDNDPWGYYIYSVLKQGSINLAFESQRMAIPEAKYLGLRSIDLERCELSDSVKISLTDSDRKRAK